MIGADTNVLVRLFVNDNAAQHGVAKRFFESRSADDPAFISLVVLAETTWVLTRRYGYSHERVVALIDDLMRSADFVFEQSALVASAIDICQRANARLADALIALVGQSEGCLVTGTLDGSASKRIPGMVLLK